ncbi:glycosyl transferase [uncultured Methanobrevibacter sp.]|jgi:chromosome segregation ATPase|uniref:glycosyl transferase n=1 Tax=uncultured Methanobrevibacter sp. TaxID=253161 RepID=UPI0025E80F1C|nr:glycosyl transferase [uncultured Methanobrevibacter sp.]
MEIGIDAEKDTLQSLIRSCLLELNTLKYELTELEVERNNDNTPQRIKELEKDIVDKEKEVSVIKFKAEDEINLLKKQLEEKDILIKNQEDRIYELDYVNNSLDEIKEYFAEQLREYKKKELADVNERLNESYKSIAEKEAQINTLSRNIDEYKIKVLKLENDVESQAQIMELEKQIELKNNEIRIKQSEVDQIKNELNILKQQTIPKDQYISLQTQFESEINAMNNEITNLKQETIPKKDYDDLQSRFDSEIKTLDSQIVDLQESTVPKQDYVNLQARFDNEIDARDSEIKYLKERSIPKEDYINLQNQLQNEINSVESELRFVKEQSVSREDYMRLQAELQRKEDKIKRLEEINAFFNELQEEQEAYETQERTPPFRLEKKQR